MPYPRHFSFRRWEECTRCGFDFPLNELSRDTYGNRLCSSCIDVDGYNEEKHKITMRLEELKVSDNEGDRL